VRGKPFEAGNKLGKGRTRGSRNKRTALVELMEDHGAAMIKQCQVLAMKGDSTALRLCMERLMPPCRAPNSRFRLPPMKTTADLVNALPVVAQEVARGRLSAQEGESIARIMETQRHTLEAEDFERRLRALENPQEEEEEKAGADKEGEADEGEEEPSEGGEKP
jgi:hypothetical protein